MIMKTLCHLILILSLLSAACAEKPAATSPQNSNTAAAQNNAVTTLIFNGHMVGGCGGFIVYKDTEDKTKVITVQADAKALNLKITPQTYNISSTPTLKIAIDDYGSVIHGEYCSDSTSENKPRPQKIIYAISGKVTIRITRKKVNLYPALAYAITVTLEEVTFPITNGSTYYIQKAEIEDVVVGVPA